MHFGTGLLRSLAKSASTTSLRTMVAEGRAVNASLTFEHIKCSRPADFVVHVELNRPEKMNALNGKLWQEIGECFNALDEDQDCRVVVLSGAGRAFCAGLDFSAMANLGAVAMNEDLDVARKFKAMRKVVLGAQEPFTAIEACQKPVVASVHGACVGGALGILTACDVRYAALDSVFSIREVDIGLSADVGTLQRMPKQVGGDSLLRELAFTARDFYTDEARELGLVSRVFPSREATLAASLALAEGIAKRSPVAVQGSKVQLNYARDHSVEDSLRYHATWNAANLLSEDTSKTAIAKATKQKDPVQYSKL